MKLIIICEDHSVKEPKEIEEEINIPKDDVLDFVSKYVAGHLEPKDYKSIPVEAEVSFAPLYAALRWIGNDYRNDINNKGAYEIMMADNNVGSSYKEDVTLIRNTLKKQN